MPIILMVWPSVAIVGSIMLYAVVAFIDSQIVATSNEDNLFASQGGLRVAVNVLLFFVGAASVLAGPVSFITGLVLLITRMRTPK